MERLPTQDDCQRCGACCCNRDENRAAGVPFYVEIDDPRSKLLARDDLRKRYTVKDDAGVPHLRLDPSGRCTALVGRLGVDVSCVVYAFRPRGCRVVTAGSAECLEARRQRLHGRP
ncbi:MAG: YkgJ family cysteine cluster protein [Myxococcaceae bacterium]|nr:YkgJ family cysteine cluster protein [Myxococcaceae bacterium]